MSIFIGRPLVVAGHSLRTCDPGLRTRGGLCAWRDRQGTLKYMAARSLLVRLGERGWISSIYVVMLINRKIKALIQKAGIHPEGAEQGSRVFDKKWILFVLGFAAFFPPRDCSFLFYDDPGYVWANPNVNTGLRPHNVYWAFTALHGDISYWHPLTWLSHQLDVQMFGLNPLGHRLVNATLHGINCVLVFSLLVETSRLRWQALAVACLFAVHPMQLESVAWISERKTLLSSLFLLGALVAYAKYIRRAAMRYYFEAMLFSALALLSKPSAVVVPLLLHVIALRIEACNHSNASRRKLFAFSISEKAPFYMMSISVAIVTLLGQAEIGSLKTYAEVPGSARLVNAVAALWGYLNNTLIPKDLVVLYERPDWWDKTFLSIVITALLSGLLAALLARKRAPDVLIGIVFWLIFLLPTLGIVQSGAQYMANRYMYLGVIGVFWAFLAFANGVLGAWYSRYARPIVISSVALAATVFCAVTRHDVKVWNNTGSLFERVVRKYPENSIAHNNLGAYYESRGKRDEAFREYTLSNALDYERPRGRLNAARLLFTAGDCRKGRLYSSIPVPCPLQLRGLYDRCRFEMALCERDLYWSGLALNDVMTRVPSFREKQAYLHRWIALCEYQSRSQNHEESKL